MAIAGFQSSFLVTSQPGVAFTNELTTDDGTHTTYTLTNAAKRYLDKTVAPVIQKANDELQTVTITGSPTGGTFTLSFGGNTTSALNWNCTAAQMQTALQALASIGANNALVTGGPGPGTPFVVQFTAGKGQTNQATMTHTDSLTGGASPAVTIVETQAGGAYATISAGFTLFRCNARVVFAVAQPAGTYIRFSSGSYLPYTTLGEANTCEFAGKMDMLPADVFQGAGGSGSKIFVPGTLTGQMKTSTWWLNQTRVNSVLARDLLVVSFVTATNNRYEGYCYAQDCNIKMDPKSLVGQDLSFQLTDEFFNA